MNGKISIDLKSLKYIFSKNKPYIFSAASILVSVFLVFQFVIPQFGALISARREAGDAALKLEILKANLDILTNVNEETLDSQLKTLKSALPLSKDFVGMLNSVYSAAQKTGANLGNFSLKIGDLDQPENNDNFPVIRLSVPVNSGVSATNSFVKAINNSTPLAEVYSVKVGNLSSTVDVFFYYKPLGAANYSQDVRVSPVSQKGLTLVNQLSEFENASSFLDLSVPADASPADQ